MSNVLRIFAFFFLLSILDRKSSAYQNAENNDTWFMYIFIGNNGTFPCSQSSPQDHIQLLDSNNNEIRLSDRVSYGPGGFRIKNFTYTDAGFYKCTAKTGGIIRTMKTFKVQVLDRVNDTNMQVPKDYRLSHLSEGEDLRLNCSVIITSVNPVINWKIPERNRDRISFRYYLLRERRGDVKGTELILRNVSLADEGEYTCQIIKSGSGTPKDQTTILTVHKSEIEANIGAKLKYVWNGKTGSFACPKTSPQERVRLFIDGDYEITIRGRVFHYPSTGFVIKNFTIMDTGIYKCTIEKNNLTRSIRKFDVRVLRDPRALGQPEIDEFKLRHVVEGQQVRVNCSAEFFRDKTFFIFWITPHADDDRIWVENTSINKFNRTIGFSELTIQNVSVQDAGLYRCISTTATGLRGSAQVTTVLTVHPKHTTTTSPSTYRESIHSFANV